MMSLYRRFPPLHAFIDVMHEVFINILCYWGLKIRNFPDQNLRLDGQTVIVTGGNRGFGAGITSELSARGARIVIACRDTAKASELVNEIKKNNSPASISIKYLDLSSFQSVKKFSSEIIREEGRVDVLINNSGIMTKDKSLMTGDGYERTIQVNYLSHALLTINLIHKMRSTSDDPRVIFVSSLAHHRPCKVDLKIVPKDYMTAYSLSKVALMMFVKKLATVMVEKNDSNPVVRVYAVDPGMSPTDILKEMNQKFKDNWFVKSPIIQQILRPPIHGSTSIIFPLFFKKSTYDKNQFYSKDGFIREPANVVHDLELSKKVWEQTFEILDLPQI